MPSASSIAVATCSPIPVNTAAYTSSVNELRLWPIVSETDPAVIKVLLKVTDKGDYDWVECGSCAAGWQVPHYAESVG